MQLIRWLNTAASTSPTRPMSIPMPTAPELLHHKAFFSTGHDEYWTNEMFNAAQSARDAGVGLAFFGADAGPLAGAPRGLGRRRRQSGAGLLPVLGPRSGARVRHHAPMARPLVEPPRADLCGCHVHLGSRVGQQRPLCRHEQLAMGVPGHRRQGRRFRRKASVGYEMDRFMPTYTAPTAISQTLLSKSPFVDTTGAADYANSSLYQAPSKAWVFAAAACRGAGPLITRGPPPRPIRGFSRSRPLS